MCIIIINLCVCACSLVYGYTCVSMQSCVSMHACRCLRLALGISSLDCLSCSSVARVSQLNPELASDWASCRNPLWPPSRHWALRLAAIPIQEVWRSELQVSGLHSAVPTEPSSQPPFTVSSVLLRVWTFYLHVCLCTMLCSTHRDQTGVRSLRTGVVGCSELPCECLELNVGPLEEQPGLTTTKASLSLSLYLDMFSVLSCASSPHPTPTLH